MPQSSRPRRAPGARRALCVSAAVGLLAMAAPSCGGESAGTSAAPAASASGAATGTASGQSGGSASTPGVALAGIAFVDSSVTSQGSRAQLPTGAKVLPMGSRITGTAGCPTNRYGTDGLIVLVMDYSGRPTAGSVTITRDPDGPTPMARSPYYLDFDPGRKLQFLGPVKDNGVYQIDVSYDLAQGVPRSASGRFELARSCPAVQ